jgi:hypothetical protein
MILFLPRQDASVTIQHESLPWVMLPELLHGGEKKVWGDAGYQGQTEAIREAAPEAQDMTSATRENEGGRRCGVALPHPQARVRLHPGALSRIKKESRVAVRRLCLGQSLPEPHPTNAEPFGHRKPDLCSTILRR